MQHGDLKIFIMMHQRQGRIQITGLVGAISVIFGSQVSVGSQVSF